MRSLLAEIWTRQVSNRLSFYDQQRIHLLDRLVLIAILLCAIIVILDVWLGVLVAALFNVLIILIVFVPVLYLQEKEKYSHARAHFVIGTSLVVTLMVFHAYESGRFVDTENVMIGFSALSIFLLERYKKILIYSVFVFWIMTLKAIKSFVYLDVTGVEFALSTINYMVVMLAIFFFVEIFRKALLTELNNSKKLNEELQSGKIEVEYTRGMLYNMIDNIPLLLAMMDNQGRFLAMNKQFATAMRIDERKMIGLNYSEVLSSEILARFDSRLQEGIRGYETEFDELIHFPNGQSQHVLGQIIPLFNDSGVYGLTVFATDVSDLKEKEQRLEQLNQTKNKLFSIIAHDLKNPINLLQGLVHISKDGLMTPEENQLFIDRIQKNLGSVSHMLENLLVWAKSQLDGYRIQRTVTNVRDEFLSVWEVYKEMAENKDLIVNWEIPATHEVLMDKNHLNMIIRNLINNAIKFTARGGKITITSQKYAGQITLRLSDTGKGMDQETVKAILSRQFVHSEYGTEGESGTGLGLSLCMEMLHQNDGVMQVQSKEGVGTTFKLLLPAV